MSFTFDPSRPVNQRVTECMINSQPVDLTRLYKMTTRGYMARGKDGYTSLLVKPEGGEAEELVSEENGVLISTIIRQFFMALKVVDRWRLWGASMEHHWDKVVQGLRRNSAIPMHEPIIENKRPLSLPPHMREEKTHRDGTSSPYDSDAEPLDHSVNLMSKVFKNDQQEILIRRILRKWRRIAGIRQDTETCDSLGIDEFQASWTKVCAAVHSCRVLTQTLRLLHPSLKDGSKSLVMKEHEPRMCMNYVFPSSGFTIV
jgi:5'-nucleotidase-like protein